MDSQPGIQVFVGSAKYVVLVDRSNIQAIGQDRNFIASETHSHTQIVYIQYSEREREIYIYRIEINAIDVSFTFFYRGLSEGLPEPQPAHHEIYGVTISNTYASPKIKNKHNIDEYNPAFLAGRLH